MNDTKKMVRAYIDFLMVGPEHQLFEPWDTPTRKRVKKRQPTLTAALKQAAKLGIAVSGAGITANGVTLTFGQNDSGRQESELDQWMAKHHAH